jgi:hypothetical protein
VPLAAEPRRNVEASLRAKGDCRATKPCERLSLVRQRLDGDRGDLWADADLSKSSGGLASISAGPIRYVLIPFSSKETNRLITGVETTFKEVTVDSPSFKSKSELRTRWAMLCHHVQAWASVKTRRLPTTPPLRLPTELPLPTAAALIGSP